MKVLTYNLLQGIDKNDNPLLMRVEMGWNETNEEIAKCEAYNGEYSIEDDGQPDPVVPESDTAMWDELAAAIAEGVDDV